MPTTGLIGLLSESRIITDCVDDGDFKLLHGNNLLARVYIPFRQSYIIYTKLWTIFRGIYISPRWGLDLGGYGVSTHISPRWGCVFWQLPVFFSELETCSNL